jgi:signal transduction histidine kinase
MRPTTELDEVLPLLDQTIDGIALVGGDGLLRFANLPFRRSAEALGLRLTGPLVDCVLELADRTTEPYAFTAAVERLRGEAGQLDFEDAAAGSAFLLDVSPADPGGRVWTLRELTDVRARERAREELVGTIGHELRTPLTSMVGFIELLQDGRAGSLEPEQERYLEIVHRAAARLQRLVDELLERSVADVVANSPEQANERTEAG